jgi:hypothetical protein
MTATCSNESPSQTIKEFIVGALAGAVTESIFYGVDSAKVLIQMGQAVKISRLLNGVGPLMLLGTAPSFGTFFACYSALTSSFQSFDPDGDPYLHVFAASTAAAVPTSFVSVPADLIKKQIFSADSSTFRQAVTTIYRNRGLAGFIIGWRINIIRDVPFVAVKMSLYEGLSRAYTARFRPDVEISGLETGGIGFFSGFLTAIVTNPMDTVNTRTKSGELAHLRILAAHAYIIKTGGFLALFRGLGPRVVTTGLGATVFWYIHYHIHRFIIPPAQI